MKAKFIINCCIGLSILLVVSGCSLGEGGTETSVRAPSSQSGSDSGSNSDNGNPNLGSDSSSSSSDSTSDSSTRK